MVARQSSRTAATLHRLLHARHIARPSLFFLGVAFPRDAIHRLAMPLVLERIERHVHDAAQDVSLAVLLHAPDDLVQDPAAGDKVGIDALHGSDSLLVRGDAPVLGDASVPFPEPCRHLLPGLAVANGFRRAFLVEEDGSLLSPCRRCWNVCQPDAAQPTKKVVKVELQSLHCVEGAAEQLVEIGLVEAPQPQPSRHQPLVLCQEHMLIFFARLRDEFFGAGDNGLLVPLGDALSNKSSIVDVGARAHQLAHCFSESHQVPPDNGWLVLVAISQHMVVVIGGIGRVKVVHKGKGSKVHGQAVNGRVVRVLTTPRVSQA
ncbi:hypothetical protein G6O67_001470 [Ophiocordyceps sinensis]|uniref:Uncharacterized protein n=1 Tax=Ophiocordyceps sinensis TaxID=72228 RepID=A0A8H4V8V0_9HYPO|nr:hypothetical protein G6O67_001470 [Ophiocordyceps sinensis]